MHVISCKLSLLAIWLAISYASMDQTYSYFHNPEFMEFASSRMRKCADNDYMRNHLNDCNTVDYLLKMTEIRRRVVSPAQSKSIEALKVESSKDIPYATYFENFVVNNVPFKGRMDSSSSLLLSDCIQGSGISSHPITGDYAISSCADKDIVSKTVSVPPIVYNSYSVRLSTPQTRDSTFVDITSQWPAIIELSGNKPRNVESCPHSMHMAVWGATEDVAVRIFDHEQASHALKPSVGKPVLHYWKYDHSGYGKDLNTSAFVDTTLLPGEFLFIPHTYLASFKALSADAFDKHPTFLRACFFDGSNLNDVRDALALEGLLYGATKSQSDELRNTHSFDFSMTREIPKDITTALYWTFPRPTVTKAEGEAVSDEAPEAGSRKTRGRKDFKGWQENTRWNFLIASLTIPPPPAPEIVSIGRTNVSLAWITPYLPDAQDKTKFGVNITVCLRASAEAAVKARLLPSRSAAADREVEGCEVLSVSREQMSEETVDGIFTGSDVPVTTFTTVIKKLSPGSSYVFRVIIFYGEAGSHPSEWTIPVETVAESPPSPIPSAVLASPSPDVCTHAFLNFTKPVDDGGLTLLGYHVHTRHIERHHHELWVWNGLYYGEESKGVVTIEVINLLPHAAYEFRVAAFNELGNASFVVSNVITTSNKNGGSVLAGAGHESRFNSRVFTDELMRSYEDKGSATFRRLLDNQPVPGGAVDDESAIVVIDDVDQTITIRNRVTEQTVVIDVWDSHWSPRLFKSSGQMVWTEPPLADSPIISSLGDPKKDSSSDASHMSGKIALVQRGAVPIVTKALRVQQEGAIACVVLDDGQCAEFDQKCMPGSSRSHGERFAVVDDPKVWKKIKIPVLLVKGSDSERLLEAVGLPAYERMQAIHNSRVAAKAEL